MLRFMLERSERDKAALIEQLAQVRAAVLDMAQVGGIEIPLRFQA